MDSQKWMRQRDARGRFLPTPNPNLPDHLRRARVRRWLGLLLALAVVWLVVAAGYVIWRAVF